MIGEIEEDVINVRSLFQEEHPSEPGGVAGDDGKMLISLKAGRQFIRVA
jgi:hypothetical protein